MHALRIGTYLSTLDNGMRRTRTGATYIRDLICKLVDRSAAFGAVFMLWMLESHCETIAYLRGRKFLWNLLFYRGDEILFNL